MSEDEANRAAAEAHFQQALAHAQKAEFDQALAQLDAALALDPGFGRAYLYRGFIYHERAFARPRRTAQGFVPDHRDLAQSVANFDRALELLGNDADIYYNRGMTRARLADVLRVQGDGGGGLNADSLAFADLSRAIAMQPDHALAYYERGLVNASHDNRAAAISDYSVAIKRLPTRPDFYFNRALMYMREPSDHAKAIADLEQVRRISNIPELVAHAEQLLSDLDPNWRGNIIQ